MALGRTFALAALIGLFALPAKAEEASFVEVSDPGQYARRLFIDMASVRRTGDQARVDALEVFSLREGNRAYATGPVTVDCRRRTVKPLSGQVFDAGGRLLETRAAPDSALPTGPAERRTISLVCEDGAGVGLLTSFASRDEAVSAVRGQGPSTAADTTPPALRSGRGIEADRVLDGQAITLPGATWPTALEDPPARPAWRFTYLADGQFSGDGTASIFVDQGTAARRSGRQLTAWVLYVYWQPRSGKQGLEPIAYSLDRVLYDCADRSFKVLRLMNYDAQGRLLFDGEPSEEFTEPEEGSSDDTEMILACDGAARPGGGNAFTRVEDAMRFALANAERPNSDAKRDTAKSQSGAGARGNR